MQYTAYIMYMYEVNYNGRTSCVSNYFHARIRLEGLLYDAECDLLAIAKFLVQLFDAREYSDLDNCMGQLGHGSWSLQMTSFDKLRRPTSSYWRSTVTISLSCTVSEINRDIG